MIFGRLMKAVEKDSLKELLEQAYLRYHGKDFIDDDPISVPHLYSFRQDIEIAGFFSALISWGNRKSIIKSASLIMQLMDNKPYDFVKNHREKDRRIFEKFVHRTFQYIDTICILDFLQKHYRTYDSLEHAFLRNGEYYSSVKDSLIYFHHYVFGLNEYPLRTRKHIATPAKGSTCKRLNMFLRWMVRKDESGVDFGLWQHIPTKDLMIPLDVHVEKVCRRIGILQRKQRDWKAVEEITHCLRMLDPMDPVRYDYALFGMGVIEKFRH